MNEDQIAQMLEMMKQLGPAQVRVIQYQMNGGHKCTDSTNLMTCCGERRCAACHIPHLQNKHGDAAVYAYTKFAAAQSLTWKVREYKQPLPVAKKQQVNKVTTRKAPASAPKQIANTKDFADSIPADKLAEVMAMLKEYGLE